MIDSPLITCVIPTYRRPRMLARAIRSVLNQTFLRLRVFVTDNASGDETARVVQAIQAQDSRVIYHCQPENMGMRANFAYGMSHVETPFFSLLSDDDILLPEFYERAYSAFQKYPQAMLVATKVPSVTGDGRFISEPLALWDRMGLFTPPTGAYRVAGIAHPTITGILFRREFLQTPYAYLDPEIYGMDYEMIFNASLNYPIVTIDYEGALFVQHFGVRAKPSDIFMAIENHLNWIRRVDRDDRFPSEVKEASRQKWRTDLSRTLYKQIFLFILNGDKQNAEKALDILNNDIGRAQQATKLRFLHKICCTLPLLTSILKIMIMHDPIIKRIRRLRHFCLSTNNAKYREYLNKS